MSEIDRPVSRARSVARGSLALLGRQAITLLVTFIGGVFLARLLSPAEFGAYALIVSVAGLTKLLVDGGLAASLIQQESEPTRDDRAAIFSFQLVAAGILAVVIIVLAPYLEAWMKSPKGTTWSLYLVAIAVLAAPFTSISFVMIERKLSFGVLGVLLTIQPIAFNLVAVCLAFLHLGVLSLGVAFAVSNILVVPAALLAVGEVPHILFRRGSLRGRFRFGLPFIGISVVSTVKDAVNPLFIGVVIGASAAGYLNWAQQIAVIGTYALSILSRLLFPVFSRVKDDPRALEAAVPKILFWANMMVAPVTVFIGLFAHELTTVLYGSQWTPAIALLYWLLLANVVSPTASVLMALMNAIGKPSVSFGFAFAWFGATWVLVPTFVAFAHGYIGYGYANAFVQLISVALIFVARRKVHFKWISALILPWAYTIVSFAVVVIPARMLVEHLSLVEILAVGAAATSTLVGGVWVFSRERFLYLWRSVFS